MAPETSAHAADETTQTPAQRRRHRGSNLLFVGALVLFATAGSLWVTGTGVGERVAAAGTSGAASTGQTGEATPTPSPAPAATPTVAGAVEAAAAAAPALATAPPGPRNLLLSADGSLDTSVTTYSDCTGATELTHSAAAVDTCVGGRTYFVGHNGGVFTPLLDLGVGDIITWYDSSGGSHPMRIVEVRDNWLRDNGVPPLANDSVVAQFQTCETAYPDGTHDRILDAVPA